MYNKQLRQENILHTMEFYMILIRAILQVLGCIVGTSLTTSIVAPPLLSLPYAFTFLSLVIGAFVTFYSYNLISRVLEHHAQMGMRQLRFRDMARDILGTSCAHFICQLFILLYELYYTYLLASTSSDTILFTFHTSNDYSAPQELNNK